MAQTISQAQQNQNAYDVGIHMRNQGWNFKATCALLGNMEVESGINPDKEQIQGPAFGMVQFDGSAFPLVPPPTYDGRTYVKNLCRRFLGSDTGYNTVLKQCQLIEQVMYNGQWIPTNQYPHSPEQFKNWDGSLEDAVYCFLRNFERAGIEHAERRIESAQKWYNNLKLDEAPPADKDPVTPVTPDNPQGGESQETIDKVTGHWETIIKEQKYTLGDGYYTLKNGILYDMSGQTSLQMLRYGDTFHVGLDYEEQKKWVEDKVKEEVNKEEESKPTNPPQPTDPDKPPITGGQVVVDSFIHELNVLVNHKPHIYYYNDRPSIDPKQCGFADCSSFIAWGLRNIHPSIWNGGWVNTGTIHQLFSANGYMIWGVGLRTDIPWDKLQAGDILNFGMTPALGAGLQSHIICYGRNGQIIDCNGSGGVQLRENCKNIVMNYYDHTYAAVYRIYK